MSLLTKLERSLGWIAIGNLPIYIVTAQAILYVWVMLNPEGVYLLSLDPAAVLYGREYWRLITFLFIMPFQNPIGVFFFLYFQYVCGSALEGEWGSFPLTLFYVVGALGAILAAFIVGVNINGAFFFTESIFLAFAALFPDFQILLFFLIPLKVKWLAWFTWIRILLGLFGAPFILKAAILVSLSHYFIFFSRLHYDQIRTLIDRMQHRRRFKDWDK